jgi:hypothetical protein
MCDEQTGTFVSSLGIDKCCLSRTLVKYGDDGGMCCRWDNAGERLLVLKRRAQPAVYNVCII